MRCPPATLAILFMIKMAIQACAVDEPPEVLQSRLCGFAYFRTSSMLGNLILAKPPRTAGAIVRVHARHVVHAMRVGLIDVCFICDRYTFPDAEAERLGRHTRPSPSAVGPSVNTVFT